MKLNWLTAILLFLAASAVGLFIFYFHSETRKQDASEQRARETTSRMLPQFDEYYSDALEQAAKHGDLVAQKKLALAYENGDGCLQDFVEAAKWFRAAAEQGDAGSQNKLGYYYEAGVGVSKDSSEAIKWYRKAAEQGFASAQFNLGLDYENGNGVTKDFVESASWYRKAAEQGNASAQLNLGVLYSNGRGVERDVAEAAKWYDKAAEQGNASAQNNLGVCYAEGNGVSKDIVLAYKWYNLASVSGNTIFKNNLSVLGSQMTAAQIAEGQQLTREFRASKAPKSGAFVSTDDIMNSSPVATGTGFFITEDGFLLTDEHVVNNAVQIRLVTSVGFVSAVVIRVDAANDLALLKVEGKFSSLPIASSRTMSMGNTVATIGFPDPSLQGFAPKLAKGEIASLSGAADDARYFQISVPLQPGNSGGALVDERGNVIGIISAKLDASVALAASGALPENVNYAVKSSFLLSFLESVPEVSAKLKKPNMTDEKFSEVVKSAQDAAVMVLVY